MSEIQDLLNTSTQAMVDDYLIIDDNSREIYVPSGELLFGVTSDEKTERKYFQCPRIVGDNVDLTQYQLYINYQNANGEKDIYEIKDVKTQDDNIIFSWLLSRKVTEYQGTVSFIICARNVNDSGVITNEWNTTIANGQCLIGLEASKQIEQENYDILEDVLKRLKLIEETGTSVDLSSYQKKTDEELKTNDKTIVGAINEIKDNQKDLPVASSTQLGGVKPVAKTSQMTEAIGVDNEGHLYRTKDITEEERTKWNKNGDYNNLENKPAIPKEVTIDEELNENSNNPVSSKTLYNEFLKYLAKNQIKTINGESIIGDGDITISSGGVTPRNLLLVVDYVTTEKVSTYTFTKENYPLIENITYMWVLIEQPSNPSNTPYIGIYLNNKQCAGTENTKVANIIKAEATNGIWEGWAYTEANTAYLRGTMFGLRSYTPLAHTFVKWEKIDKFEIKSWTDVFEVGTKIKVYGC